MAENANLMPKWLSDRDQNDPVNSAVEYLAGASDRFNWVGFYRLNEDILELGPFKGKPTVHTKIPVGRGVCGVAVARDQDQNVSDVLDRANYLACSPDTRSELVCLVRSPSGQIVGQIDIDSHKPSAFGPDEEKLVKTVAKDLGELWKE